MVLQGSSQHLYCRTRSLAESFCTWVSRLQFETVQMLLGAHAASWPHMGTKPSARMLQSGLASLSTAHRLVHRYALGSWQALFNTRLGRIGIYISSCIWMKHSCPVSNASPNGKTPCQCHCSSPQDGYTPPSTVAAMDFKGNRQLKPSQHKSWDRLRKSLQDFGETDLPPN